MLKIMKVTILILSFATVSFGQGAITGSVVSDEGDPIVGADVMLEGTYIGAAASSDGIYTIGNVPAGNYVVIVSAIGYKNDKTEVDVADGLTAQVSFQLGMDVLGLSDVVVTGVVNPKSKLESSVSISTIDASDIEKSAPRTTAEIFRTIPGVRSEASGGDGNTNITVRGVPISSGGSKYLQLQEDGLPVLQFGDIAFATADIFLRADYNIARVEAIRGGSASTMASNSPAGIINMISKTGAIEGGSVRSTVGLDFNTSRLDFEYGSPFGSGLSFHVGGFFRQGEGPRTAGYSANNGGQLKLNLTKRFENGFARIYYKYLNDHSIAYMPMPLKVEGTNADPQWSSVDGYDAASGTVHSPYLLQNLGLGVDGELRRSNVADGMHPLTQSIGAEFNSIFGDGWKIVNRARLAFNSGRFVSPFPAEIGTAQGMAESVGDSGAYLQYADGSTFDGERVLRIHMFDTELNNFNNFINDFKVSKSLGNAEVTVGYYRSVQKIVMSWLWNSYITDINGEAARLIDVFSIDSVKLSQNGLYAYGVPAWGNCCTRSYDVDYETSAPYVSGAMDINDDLNLDFSLRFDNGHVTGSFAGPVQTQYDVNNDGTISPNEESVSAIDHANATPVDYTYAYTSYSVGANYKLSEAQAVFARYSTGGAAKADRLLFGRDQYLDGTTMFAKDMVTQAELGYKHLFNKGGLFITGFMATTNEEGGYEATTQKVIENDYSALGVEVEGAYDLGALDLRGGMTYTQATISSGDNEGNAPRRQPAVMYNFVPSYSLGDHSLGLSLIGQSSAYAQDSNELVMPGYLIVNGFLNYQLTDRFVASVNANNLTNALGITESEEGSITDNEVNYVRARPIMGRSVSLSVGYQF